MQYEQWCDLYEKFEEIFIGNSVVSYNTTGLVVWEDAEIILSNGERYLLTAGNEWGSSVSIIMNFKLNEVIERVEIIPLDEEAYNKNPHRRDLQYHRIEFYGSENKLVGVMVTAAYDGRHEEGYLYIKPDEFGLELDIPDQDQEIFNDFRTLIENTEVTVKCLLGLKDNGITYIRFLVEAPGGSMYVGDIQQNVKGFVGVPVLWTMFEGENFTFFSTSLEGGIEKDREILKNFVEVVYSE